MQVDKHTIAWFKIAECVSRGEKERALGVYRLLSHSFNDTAIARQLEADIYLAFQDHNHAIELYRQSAEQYKKSGRLLESAGIHEHLITLLPHDQYLVRDLIDIYKKLGITTKVHTYSKKLTERFVHKKQWDEITALLDEFCGDSLLSVRMGIYQHSLLIMHTTGESSERLKNHVEKALDDFFVSDDQGLLQEFLSIIQAIDDELYEHACYYLQQ